MTRQFSIILVLAIAVSALAAACSEDAPSIPHPITSTADTYCKSCHENGAGGAPKSPHPGRTNCVGCHSPTDYQPPVDAGADVQDSGTDGNTAPPMIPHAVSSTADTSCLVCHKNAASDAPQTPHPERTGCVDCHKSTP